MKILKPIPPLVEHAKEIVALWEEKFPNYEIETIVADLEVNLPKIAKGSLKVSMKKKSQK